MGFSAKQLRILRRNLDHRFIRSRISNGRELNYIEGWYAVSQANRIFGFDGWSRETLEARCVLARENRGSFLAVYTAKVRITVQAEGATILREGHGSGEGRGPSPGEVHDIALKAAETDATKRALATFGRPFGLELSARTKSKPHPRSLPPALPAAPPSAPRLGLHPDDTTPIPGPRITMGSGITVRPRSFSQKTNPRREQQMQLHLCWRPQHRPSCPGPHRQEPARHRRAQAFARQGASEVCGFTTLSRLRAAAL